MIGRLMSNEVVCDAYSGVCLAPPQVFDRPEVATPTVGGPAELPLTGFTYGDMLGIALMVVLLGFIILRLAKRRKS